MKKIIETDYVGFIPAIKHFWKGAVSFKGLTRRSGYWWTLLFEYLFILALNILIVPLAMTNSASASIALIIIIAIIGLSFFLSSMSMLCRRLQDAGLSFGLSLTLVISNIVLCVLCLFSRLTFIFWIDFILALFEIVIILVPSGKLAKDESTVLFRSKDLSEYESKKDESKITTE